MERRPPATHGSLKVDRADLQGLLRSSGGATGVKYALFVFLVAIGVAGHAPFSARVAEVTQSAQWHGVRPIRFLCVDIAEPPLETDPYLRGLFRNDFRRMFQDSLARLLLQHGRDRLPAAVGCVHPH